MKIAILAGGGGTRLFPLSRKSRPKQFLSIDSDASLLEETIVRFRDIVRPEDLIVVTNEAYVHHVQTELSRAGASAAHIVLEPVARNTAPAIALAVSYCLSELGAAEDEVLFVSTSDHIIRPARAFQSAVMQSEYFAGEGYMVTFGVKPTRPETGFGYIETGEALDGAFLTASFKEKPDLETAKHYLAQGNYYWNSGLFAFRMDTYLSELSKYAPEVAQHVGGTFEETLQEFSSMPDISIDYAVAEKSKRGVTLPLKLYWNDVGSWDAIYEVLDKDTEGNAIKGDVMTIDCCDNLFFGQNRLIAGIGLKDVMVVETDDVILVAQKGESQKVKDLVKLLKQRGRKEAVEHTTLYYSWGYEKSLGAGKGYRMRQRVVHPGHGLSMRMHYHRSVHWVVTCGAAEVTIDGERSLIHDNQSVYIPQTKFYGLKNLGKIDLVLLEVENGDYLEDDDVVWYQEEKALTDEH